MTNEEKAKDISYKDRVVYETDVDIANGLEYPTLHSGDECYKSALDMAEWKDQQFAKYLEERRLDIADTNCFSFEGILEFIEETEQLLKEGRLFEFRRFSGY